jgi:ferritin
MISKKMNEALNAQIKIEGESSHTYLSMASWAEKEGLNGVAAFFYTHADEEKMHMLKLMKYINERDGRAIVPQMDAPKSDYTSVREVFEDFLKHEVSVSEKIHELVELSMKERDYSTHNFLQWYVSEQIEEESLARTVLDKLKLIGEDKGGFYLFDRDINSINPEGSL